MFSGELIGFFDGLNKRCEGVVGLNNEVVLFIEMEQIGEVDLIRKVEGFVQQIQKQKGNELVGQIDQKGQGWSGYVYWIREVVSDFIDSFFRGMIEVEIRLEEIQDGEERKFFEGENGIVVGKVGVGIWVQRRNFIQMDMSTLNGKGFS